MAEGFALNIDSSFLQNLEKVDKKMADLLDKSNTLSKSVVSAFQQMSTQGVEPYLRKLQEQKAALEAIKNVNITGNSSSQLKALQRDVTKTVDDINKLILAIEKTPQFKTFSTQQYNNYELQLFLENQDRKKRAEQDMAAIQERNRKQYIRELEDMFKREDVSDKQRYELWLMRKHSEQVEHKRAEEAKLKATQDAIAKQNSMFAQLETYRQQNTQAKNNSIQAKQAYEQQYRDYERLFTEAIQREERLRQQAANAEMQRVIEVQDRKKRAEQDMRAIEQRNHNQRQKEYEEMFRKIDELAKRQSAMRAKSYQRTQQYGDTSGQATAAYNRLYSDKGVQSLNNMNRVLQQLQNAQNKLNLNTEAGRKKYDELDKMIQRVQKDIDKATNSNEKFNKSHRNLMDTAGELQRKLALVFSVSAIQGYMNKLIQIRGEFEKQRRSLQVLLQNKDEADKLWQQTVDLAVRSPFRVKELITYTRQLAAYRIETDKLHDTTKRLADISAGLGVDMQRLILAFGQVRAANFLRGTELRQFTEAGIPMLDELAKYFTEVEGRAISAGDVFERISKRMVSFGDVEEVFHRMTDAGGVFYKMQEEQSETLQGMISNLHDSIDLMLNDIGKTNDGVLKGTVETLKEIVENWKAFSIVLQQVGAVVGLITLRKAILSLVALSPKLYSMAGGLSALTAGSMTFSMQAKRMAVSIRALTGAMMANPLFAGGAILAAILSVVHALWQYNDAVESANEIYDEVSKREIRRLDELEALNKKIQENNKIIKEATGKTQEKSKAEKENAEVLETLKSKYPELYDKVVKQEDGTLNLNAAIEEQNRLIELNISLQQQAKGGWFQDTLEENYTDAIEAQADLEGSINDVKAAAIDMQSKLVYAFQQGDISEDTYKDVIKLVKALKSAKDFDEITKAYSDLFKFARQLNSSKGRMPILDLVSDITKVYTDAKNASNDYKNSLEDLQDNLNNQMGTFKVGITEQIELDPEKGKEKAAAWVDGQLEELGVYDKEIKKWAEEYITKQVGVELVFIDKKSGEAPLDDWAIRVNDAITEVNNKIKKQQPDIPDNWLFPLAKSGQTKEQYLNFAKGILDIAKATYTEGQKIEDEVMVSITNALKPYAKEVENILNIQQKTTPKGQGKDWISEVVKSVRDAHKEYLSLNKTLDAASARQMTLAKYADLFREAAQHTQFKGMDLEDFDFTTEAGTISALESMLNTLPESAKNARLTIQKALKDITGERTIRLKVEEDKALIDQIEDMFSGYEMSIELQKLNIPQDLAKQLFNIDTLTLPELKHKVVSMESQFVGTDMEEEYRKFLKKISEIEDKERVENLKKYSKYLLKTQSEKVKIKLEEIRQIQEIEKLNIDEGLKNQMKQGVRDETQQALDKEAWESFKNTDLYVQMFEDLGVVSNKVLSDLKERLTDMRGSLKDLSPTELKEIVAQLEKVTDEQISRNPFENFGKNMRDGIDALKRLKKEQEAYNEALKNQETAQGEVDRLQVSIASAKAEKEKANAIIESKDATEEQVNEANRNLIALDASINADEALLELAIQRLAAEKGITDEAARRLIITRQEASAAIETINSIGQKGTQAVDSIQNLTGMLENWGVEFGEEIEGVLSGVGQMFGALESIDLAKPMSIITGSINFVAGLGNTIASIFGFGNKDKKKEKQIQREIKFVEDLEKAYEKLEKQIDEAYSIDTLQRSGKQAKANLENQIDSYERMIAAEEDKKKTDKDKIKEWENTIEDIREQIDELNKELVSTATGGIMDDVLSASQEFTDAWLEAFNETEDGLSGLEDNFKETMLEMVKQQASMLITQAYVDKWKKELEKYINPDDLNLTTAEAGKWVDTVTSSLPQLNEALENYFTSMKQAGVDLGGENGELSGLSKSISGITEQQADILSAYLNSIRWFVSEQNTYLAQIAANFGNTEIENPMVSQLRIIAQQTSAINTLLNSLTAPHPTQSGRGIKVII